MSAGAEIRPWADLMSMHAGMAADIAAMGRETQTAMMRLGAALGQEAPAALILLYELVVRSGEIRAELERLAGKPAAMDAVWRDGVAFGEARAAGRERQATFAVIAGEAAGALTRARGRRHG